MRRDGRAPDRLRPVHIVPGFLPYAEGSVLIAMGETRVICAVTVEETVPPHRRGSGRGWLTAEYRMLPRATLTRTPRETVGSRPDGRTYEIQRLIGRSLRCAVDLDRLGERTLIVDCDVITADGGTRTAAITGGFVATVLSLRRLVERGALGEAPIRSAIAAVSVGIVSGTPMLDLCYAEDAAAETDLNLVATADGDIVEIQGTAEQTPFARGTLDRLIDLALRGIDQLVAEQRRALGE